MWARLIWHLDQINHRLLRRFHIGSLCNLNERLIWGDALYDWDEEEA